MTANEMAAPLSFSQRALRAWSVYTERRVLIILLLGFSSGLPLALTGSTLSIWMKTQGVDLKTIGLFALAGLPYVLKFLWAPLVDHARVPFLTRYLGRRRSWLVTTQLALAAAIVAMGQVDPVATPLLMAAAAVAVAFCSATQDIVIDAYRVESLGADSQAAAMANYVAAYRVAMLTSTAGAVGLVSLFEDKGVDSAHSWPLSYGAMAALMAVGLAASLFAHEPKGSEKALETEPTHFMARLRHAVIDPFVDFAMKPQWLAILSFVVLFKFGDAFAGHMVGPFALSIGFDKAVYAGISNGVGLPAALIGGFLGGFLTRATGVRTSLWIGGILQAVSNLVFCWLAFMGPQAWALGVAVATESLTGAIGTVVFVAWISSLCSRRAYTATQFALLSALSAVGRTVLSSSTGYVAEATGWVTFFFITTLLSIPGLVLLWRLNRSGTIGQDSKESISGQIAS